MRHQYNKLIELKTWPKTRHVFVRWLLTSLVKYGHVTTTSKRAKVLKSEADSFFSRLIGLSKKYDEQGARREAIRIIKSTIFGEEEGKKIMDELLPKYTQEQRTSSFVADYKIGFKPGDGAEKIRIALL